MLSKDEQGAVDIIAAIKRNAAVCTNDIRCVKQSRLGPGCSRPTWLTRLPECDIFCVFNLISQIRVVSRDALKVFHQQHANFAEPMLDRKCISSLIKMLGFANVHPCCKARQMFDRSDA